MKKELVISIGIIIMFILNGILLIKLEGQKRIYNSKKVSEISPSPAISSFEYLLSAGLAIQDSRIQQSLLLTSDLNKVEVDSVFINKRIVIFLGKDVCSPCVSRFFDALVESLGDFGLEGVVLISEAWNYRDIILLKEKYKIISNLFFCEGTFFSTKIVFEKPVLFLLDSSLIPQKILVYDDFLEGYLPQYLMLLGEGIY